jgi:hypothetical protein
MGFSDGHQRRRGEQLDNAADRGYVPPHLNPNLDCTMKRLLFALCLTVLVAPALTAQDLTKEERKQALNYLEKTRDDLKAATKGLSEAQWNFKPAPEHWSAAEIVEHIVSTEDLLMETIRDKVMKAPAPGDRGDVKSIDQFILENVPNRSQKVQAPEPLRPSNRFGSPKDSLKRFADSRAKTINFLKDTKDLRQHAIDSPFGKKFDGYQWILFIGAHNERHLKQLNEVKASPDFPWK